VSWSGGSDLARVDARHPPGRAQVVGWVVAAVCGPPRSTGTTNGDTVVNFRSRPTCIKTTLFYSTAASRQLCLICHGLDALAEAVARP